MANSITLAKPAACLTDTACCYSDIEILRQPVFVTLGWSSGADRLPRSCKEDLQIFGFQFSRRNQRRSPVATLAAESSQAAQPVSQGATNCQPPLTTPFHLAIPVHNLELARDFYGRVLACPEGRSAKTWVDYNLFGHQVVCHLVANYNAASSANAVDGDPVPVPHFGLAMSVPDFHALAERVKENSIKFIIEPHIRFKGQPGEQWTMFFQDPSGNSLEFKAMTNPNNLFAKYVVNE